MLAELLTIQPRGPRCTRGPEPVLFFFSFLFLPYPRARTIFFFFSLLCFTVLFLVSLPLSCSCASAVLVYLAMRCTEDGRLLGEGRNWGDDPLWEDQANIFLCRLDPSSSNFFSFAAAASSSFFSHPLRLLLDSLASRCSCCNLYLPLLSRGSMCIANFRRRISRASPVRPIYLGRKEDWFCFERVYMYNTRESSQSKSRERVTVKQVQKMRTSLIILSKKTSFIGEMRELARPSKIVKA